MTQTALMALKPEINLAVFGLVLVVYGAIRGDKASGSIRLLAMVGLLASLLFLLVPRFGGAALGDPAVALFGQMFVQDGFSRFVKVVLLAGSFLALLMSKSALENEGLDQFEYPVLILFATVGMMLMVSAGDFLALYVGLELQSLALYVLAAIRRDHARSSEAGLKYFVLGALSSGLILYGISLIYGYTGKTQFAELAPLLHTGAPLGVVVGLVFICAALAFKVSAVPFHMWTPDVYEGAPTPVTAFFAAAPKVAALALFIRVLEQPFFSMAHQWTQIIVFISVASMLLGSFGGLAQSNIKRLLAYSSIANAGYALVGLAIGTEAGIQSFLIYVAIYFLNALGAFGVLLCLRRKGKLLEHMTDLSGLSRQNPMLAFAMVVFMFSLAGVPPLAGFFNKYFIFLAAVKAGLVPLAIIGVLSSVVACYYYLRVIKLMYFDDGGEAIEVPNDPGLHAVWALAALVMLFFILWPAALSDAALIAAHSLFAA